jgi:hypothetical protein
MPRDASSIRDQLVIGVIAGAALGASAGLIAFGEIVFVPPLTMLVGGVSGVMVAGRLAGVQATLSELLEVVFEGESRYRSRESQPPVARSGPRPATRSSGPRSTVAPRVRIPRPTGPPPPLPPGRAPIDLNTAGVDELTDLPGVVHASAARIVAYRNAHGPFGDLSDLEGIWGFDAERIAHLALWATLSSGQGPQAVASVAESDGPPAGATPAVPA